MRYRVVGVRLGASGVPPASWSGVPPAPASSAPVPPAPVVTGVFPFLLLQPAARAAALASASASRPTLPASRRFILGGLLDGRMPSSPASSYIRALRPVARLG